MIELIVVHNPQYHYIASVCLLNACKPVIWVTPHETRDLHKLPSDTLNTVYKKSQKQIFGWMEGVHSFQLDV